MKKSTELRQAKGALIEELEGILATAESEKRSALNETEQQREAAIQQECEDLDKQIETAEKRENLLAQKAKKDPVKPVSHVNGGGEARELGKYSVSKALSEAADGKLSGLEKELHDDEMNRRTSAGMKVNSKSLLIPDEVLRATDWGAGVEQRAQTAGVAAEGGNLIATDQGGFVAALRNKTAVMGGGATVLSGLSSNIDLPTEANVFAPTWKAENADADQSDASFGTLSMRPKRLAGQMIVSNRLIAQSTPGVEMILRNQISTGYALEIDRAAINGSGTGEEPTGILNATGTLPVALGTAGGVFLREHAMEMEKLLGEANAGDKNLKFLTTFGGRSKMKNTKVDDGSGLFLWQNDNSIIGYNAMATNQLPKDLSKGGTNDLHAVILGALEELYIGFFGGIEIITENITRARQDQTVMTLNIDTDILTRRPSCFAVVKDFNITA